MFSFSKPTRSQIDQFIAAARETDITYPHIGQTKNGFDGSTAYTIDHNTIVIGRGETGFEKAKQAIREWKMFDMPWVEVCWPDTPIEEDRTVAILIRHFGFYSLNAARIVYTIDEPDWFGFAYGTLRDHGESGEERFSVRFDRESGDVIYDLYAFSRPNYLSARLARPLTRMLQKRFAVGSLKAMRAAVHTQLT
jgi:uncharacterized protein (UPF0548 family)